MSPPVHDKIETPTKKWVKFEEEEGKAKSPEKEETQIKQNGEEFFFLV